MTFHMKTPRAKDKQHLKDIADLTCLICGTNVLIDAAHIRFSSARAAKKNPGKAKPHDRWTVPLCRTHHDHQHKMDEEQFWNEAGIDPLVVASFLWGESGNHEAMEIIVNHARENRNEKGVTSDFTDDERYRAILRG